MTESEWFACSEPDLMLEHLVGKVEREKLVKFVRQCWERAMPNIADVPRNYTVVDQYAESAVRMSDMDAATYAAEAALKAAGWAPDLRRELEQQAVLLRRLVGNPFQAGTKS